MSQYPISCIPCRRRKVKCNRRKPCSYCVKNKLKCEFPPKFRNIRVQENDLLNASAEDPTIAEELKKLRHENSELRKDNEALGNQIASLEPGSGQIPIKGETTEHGEKYYGPLLSNYMIDLLQRDKDKSPVTGTVSDSEKSESLEQSDDHKSDDSNESIQEKKQLPQLLAPDASTEENAAVLVFLVRRFFDISMYENFISQPQMVNFVENYNLIKDDHWENDDDLLLLHMILVLLVQRLTPEDYNRSGLSKKPLNSMTEVSRETTRLVKKILFPRYVCLRHNLLDESIVTVQAHILCIEWHIVENLYEEAWSMMFHSCSIAYSIGLHVMFNLRTSTKVADKTTRKIVEMTEGKENAKKTDEELGQCDVSSPSDEDDDDYKISRFKVWFALKHISGLLCSMLGRPSPILIQVNLLVLLSAHSPGLSKMGVEMKETQAHLKLGLSECVRLSNAMLIESFMMNFTINDIMQLEVRFQEESKALTWFASEEYQKSIKGKEHEMNQFSDIPVHISKCEALSDLVALHVNRAKLLQPFMNQFVGTSDNDYLFTAICGSVLEFLKCSLSFVKSFLHDYIPKLVGPQGDIIKDVKLNKSLKIHFPFVESFIYQGMIVVFSLLRSKAADLLKNDCVDFVKEIKSKLTDLVAVNKECESLLYKGVKFWPKNVTFLANKNIQYTDQIFKRYEEYLESQSTNGDIIFGSDNTDTNTVLGINMADPFWITNPENYPCSYDIPLKEDNAESQDKQSSESSKGHRSFDIQQLINEDEDMGEQNSYLFDPQATGTDSQSAVLEQAMMKLQSSLSGPSGNGYNTVAHDSNGASVLSDASMGFQSAPTAMSTLSSLDQFTGDQTEKN